MAEGPDVPFPEDQYGSEPKQMLQRDGGVLSKEPSGRPQRKNYQLGSNKQVSAHPPTLRTLLLIPRRKFQVRSGRVAAGQRAHWKKTRRKICELHDHSPLKLGAPLAM